LPLPAGNKGEGLLYSYEQGKVRSKSHEGRLWLCPDFPLELKDLLPVFSVLSPTSKHFDKLHQFISLQMPDDGFPGKAGMLEQPYR
jgi:hypothetical protein